MPELPEVETVVRELRPLIQGQRITGHGVFDPKLNHLEKRDLRGFQIQSVSRHGKLIVLELRDSQNHAQCMAIHLRMSGRLLWAKGVFDSVEILAEKVHSAVFYEHDFSLKPRHLRFVLFSECGALAFFDPRRFGTIEIFSSLAELHSSAIDPTTEFFSAKILSSLLQGSKQPLKPWLLRQDKLVGIGNIYASEILYRAKLHPERHAGSLEPGEIILLAKSIQSTLDEAIRRQGTTFSDFQKPSGEAGGFQELLQVYEREGLPCHTCHGLISRSVQAGRSTYFCAHCQKMKRERSRRLSARSKNS